MPIAPRAVSVHCSTPLARELRPVSILGGTVTPVHFLTESARTPRGAATFSMDIAPMMPNVLARLPYAITTRAPDMAVRPLPISSHDIEANFSRPLPRVLRLSTAGFMDKPPIALSELMIDPPASTTNAPPMPVRPRAISPHWRAPIC